ncbi:Signal transduction histidine-protein kinase/phosphatase DegS [compost metagenome]|uniref:histidine kinase n=1 Tax=Pseudomonas wadenswilerensis TaxID=1785161 RepID=A0A380SYR9_9PSED|nr:MULTISPECIES: sensor histidine kinase [Pseudomonas]MCE5982691.1 sensor histidine kinase [Pseudomonas sp. LF19]UVM24602.1 sensor histidine kinase [Pseudomonas wadenswilerensis]SPO65991.1 Sensor histidine kinase [Pseudomonas sp. JV241A]SUQ62428.1 Signal transduction histidine-protein kinase/phosphatase UhpB [Pseudomonas wadenswilerensis]
MFSSLKTLKRWRPGASLLRWATALLCLASVAVNLALYLLEQPLPAAALALQLIALLSIAWQLRQWARSIALRPAELADRLLKVQESERQRLSRELHDDIGQMLTAAKLQADWLQRRAPAELQEHCSTLRSTLDDTLANVRDVSAILNPRQLSSLGLEASLRAHLLRTLENTNVHWSLECRQRLGGIPEDMAIAAFRITQEAVTNILRHAKANNLVVRIQRQSEGLALSISDDGLGFSPASSPADEGQRGMAGMLERVGLLNGTLSVNSQPGLGTQIDALIPWPPRTLERAKTNNAP